MKPISYLQDVSRFQVCTTTIRFHCYNGNGLIELAQLQRLHATITKRAGYHLVTLMNLVPGFASSLSKMYQAFSCHWESKYCFSCHLRAQKQNPSFYNALLLNAVLQSWLREVRNQDFSSSEQKKTVYACKVAVQLSNMQIKFAVLQINACKSELQIKIKWQWIANQIDACKSPEDFFSCSSIMFHDL